MICRPILISTGRVRGGRGHVCVASHALPCCVSFDLWPFDCIERSVGHETGAGRSCFFPAGGVYVLQCVPPDDGVVWA